MTHDLAEWKDEIAWMSLYFSAAVWASLALCVCYSLEDHLPRYRTEQRSQARRRWLARRPRYCLPRCTNKAAFEARKQERAPKDDGCKMHRL